MGFGKGTTARARGGSIGMPIEDRGTGGKGRHGKPVGRGCVAREAKIFRPIMCLRGF